MSEKIDILTPKYTDCSFFTVNNAVNSVDLNLVDPGPLPLYAGNNKSKFQRGDCFVVISAGYFIPEGFRIYGYESAGADLWSVPMIQLTALKSTGGPQIAIMNFGNLGLMRLPFPNYEFSIGTFTDTEEQNINSPTFELTTIFPYWIAPDQPQISMINVPVALNGIVFRIVPFFKVLHNFDLT